MKLDGKIAVVTGGAMGNGLGIVKVFLKYGAKVIIFDYSDELEKTISNLKSDGYDVLGYKVDISNNNEVINAVKEIENQHDHVDILVNNAGICILGGFDEMSYELRDKHFDINIKGTWNVTHALLPLLRKAKKASIVNLSSVTGVSVADSGEVAYATTKAAVLGFTKALAMELVKDNIRVNAILPGYIMTPMVDSMAKQSNASNPQSVIDGIANAIPMKRLGAPEELGELSAFLASDEASYITGQGIVIDGASTLPETLTMGV
jgi:NAD(P)-dependent dehydrogenase (short-subunit alcohol dehydrogenase family)